MAYKVCAKLKSWLHFSDVIKMAAILCKITSMTTKARAKLETWQPRLVRNYIHVCHFNNVINMAIIISILTYK